MPPYPVFAQAASIAVLLALSGFFSGSEAALFSLPASAVERFRGSSSGAGRAVSRLLSDPQALLITILIGNLAVNLMATSSVTTLLVATLGDRAGSWIAWLGMSMVILVAGEVTPKVVALHHSVPWAAACGRPMRALCLLLAPIRIVLVRLVAPLTGGWYIDRRSLLERTELQTAVQEAAENGSVQPFEAEVLLGLLGLEEIRVREVMTPRVLIRGIREDAPLEEARRLFRRWRRTRLPVFAGSVDTTVGILRIHDLTGLASGGEGRTVGAVSRPVLFVPENLSIDRLIMRFRSEEDDIAMVLDEFGSVAGLVTLRDVMDEVLGRIPDRHDPPSPSMVLARDGTWELPGDFPLDGLEHTLGIRVSDRLVETVGGRVVHLLGRIPAPGETVDFPEGLRVTVIRAEPRRVTHVAITRLAAGERA